MYFRRKTSAGRAYLQIVESRRDGDQVRQQVIATLGRFDELQASGQLERLVRSGARFAAKAMVLSAASNDAAIEIAVRRIGPALVFERLWEETGCRAVVSELAGKRKHGFALERAVFLTVLHRLLVSGSDRAADRWREDYAIAGVEGLDLHHLYRAMAWLGEELPEKEQDGRTPFAPRCVKDVVEERLFAHRRDLLTRLDLVFMDTTSLYFEGAGGQTLGQHGYSKDHRPDLRQMILAVLIDGDGRPVCSEMWPGNTADPSRTLPRNSSMRNSWEEIQIPLGTFDSSATCTLRCHLARTTDGDERLVCVDRSSRCGPPLHRLDFQLVLQRLHPRLVVLLRDLDGRVPEQHRHRLERHAALEQLDRKRVPEHVRVADDVGELEELAE